MYHERKMPTCLLASLPNSLVAVAVARSGEPSSPPFREAILPTQHSSEGAEKIAGQPFLNKHGSGAIHSCETVCER
jgi:hypothetical protein